MKLETVGKVMIAFGVILLLYAFSMPVTVGDSGIVNIHLISQRQNTLLLGGLAFLSGIIIFAVFKLKQTKEESDQEEQRRKERAEQAKELLNSATLGASAASKSILSKLDSGPMSTVARIVSCIACGAVAGYNLAFVLLWLLATFTDFRFGLTGALIVMGLTILAMAIYAFRNRPTLRVIGHLVIAAVLAVVINLMVNGIFSTKEDCNGDVLLTDECKEQRFGQSYRGRE